ncbi:MAG: hypothetical protein ACP5QU_02410 [Anaerolineae bacterium]
MPTSSSARRTEALFIIIVFLLIAAIATAPAVDSDMWWHLRNGAEMAQQQNILLKDIFSYTRAGAPWVNAFWLSDLGLYGLWQLGGPFAITLGVALLAVALMSLLFRHMEGSPYLRGLLLLLAMLGIQPNWSARPQILSFLLLAILDDFLDRHRMSKRQPLWVLPLFFALWGNLHGGFIWGMLLLLATIVGSGLDLLLSQEAALSWKDVGVLTLWFFLAGIAIALNPNGFALWRLPFEQVHVSLGIQEWLSPDFHQPYAHPLLWLLFLWIASLAYSVKRPSFVDLLKGLGFTYLFFVAQRNMEPYTIILLPILARTLSPALESFASVPLITRLRQRMAEASSGTRPPSARFNFLVNTALVTFLATGILFRAWLVSQPHRAAQSLPVGAVEWIKKNRPEGRLFNSYNWGGYLIWELQEYPVFIDGRADLYGNDLLAQWHEVVNAGPDALAILDRWQVHLVLLEPEWPIIPLLEVKGWQVLYRDSLSVVLARP